MYNNDKILCYDCQHRDVCSFKAEFIKAKKAVDEVYVERTVCDPNSFGMVKLSNIPWIHPVELKCKHHLLNIGKGVSVVYYKTCPYCGANLDPEEKCDCQKEEKS